MYHLGPIPTNDNNNSKFLAAAVLVGFDKFYPKCIPYTPMRDLTSRQRGVVENPKFVKYYDLPTDKQLTMFRQTEVSVLKFQQSKKGQERALSY